MEGGGRYVLVGVKRADGMGCRGVECLSTGNFQAIPLRFLSGGKGDGEGGEGGGGDGVW